MTQKTTITKQTAPLALFDTLEHMSETLGQTPVAAQKYAEDYRLASEFLYSYRGSTATFNAYRREIERFLHWCWSFIQKSLKDIKRADVESFIDFCKQPPAAWITTQNYPRFSNQEGQRVPNPNWRPFVASVSKAAHRLGEQAHIKTYSPSQKALQAIFAVLGSFYTYLIQEDYVAYNPVAQIRQKSKYIRKEQSSQVIRRLSDLQWAYVIETATLLAASEPETHERTLFIMNALYGMYLRISELAASERWEPQMGDFHRDRDGHWWFRTVGKGNKERIITVSDDMLLALKRYRLSLGMPELPFPGESTPILMKSKGRGAISSTRRIRMIVQDCFDAAIARLQQDNFDEEAEQLKAATVHWLRHTGISDDVKTRPREHVRDDAGHGSSAITDRYIDVELRARHASGRKKKIHPDE